MVYLEIRMMELLQNAFYKFLKNPCERKKAGGGGRYRSCNGILKAYAKCFIKSGCLCDFLRHARSIKVCWMLA